MKIGFFLDSKGIEDVNFSNIEDGNPGVGGTQFMILSISYYIKKIDRDIDILLLTTSDLNLPNNLEYKVCNNIVEATKTASNENCDIFVFRAEENCDLYNLIDDLKLKSVAWAHNFPTLEMIDQIKKCEYVKRYLCVGKEQYLMLEDSCLYDKMSFIYNALDFKVYNEYIKNINNKENIVCYMGSLVPVKGFHVLAKQWKKIKKAIPDAKLYIVGSGQLYDRNLKMGANNIAEQSYENEFLQYLYDESGEIDKDVYFFGSLGGKEKLDIISKAKVGVVNPTARTETFGISAIEFEALGIPVVTKAKNGLIDTVKNKRTGILINNKSNLSRSIIKILKDKNNMNYRISKEAIYFVNKSFDIYNISSEWIRMFQEIDVDQCKITKNIEYNIFSNFKWLIKVNKNLKKIKFFENSLSVYELAKIMNIAIKSIKNKALK